MVKTYWKAARVQIRFLIEQKISALVFLVLLILMLFNFRENVMDFRGYDVISMYHPMKLLTLSFNKTAYRADSAMMLIQLTPLLVCLPAAMSLDKERQTGQSVLIIARVGGKIYLWSKVIAVFVVTAVVFSLPFLLEIMLNCISFPLGATGDFYNLNAYEPQRLASEALYQLTWLYRLSPYLYAVAGTLLFGSFAGLLSAATVTLSALVRVKFRVMLMIPVFLLLQLTLYLGGDGSKSWYNYVLFFNDTTRSTLFFVVLVFALAVFTLVGTSIASRKDWLS